MSKSSKDPSEPPKPKLKSLSKGQLEEIANEANLSVEQIKSVEKFINEIYMQQDNEKFKGNLNSQLKKVRSLTALGMEYLISLIFCGSEGVSGISNHLNDD